MKENTLTTVFYKYNPYATWIIIGYIILVIGFFFASATFPEPVTAAGAIILFLMPVYAAVKKRSFLKLRTWDPRSLILSSSYIQVGGQRMELSDIGAIALYIHSFYGFRYRLNRTMGRESQYGDENTISVRYQGTVTDYSFFLPDFGSYQTLCAVADDWQGAGVSLVVKEAFDRDFVRDQVNRFGA